MYAHVTEMGSGLVVIWHFSTLSAQSNLTAFSLYDYY